MSAITVDGDLVHYEVLGRGGRPVILLHGWIGSWRYWIPTMRQLQLKYRVYALDFFGYGDSGKNPAKYPITHQVAMLREFMDQLGIPKAAVLAHGLGAQIALEFASQYPNRVARMLLVSAPLFDPGDLDTRVPPGTRVLLTGGNSQAQAVPPDRSQPLSQEDTIARRPSGLDLSRHSQADQTVPSTSRETVTNPNAINREQLREAAIRAAMERKSLDDQPTPAPATNGVNPLKNVLTNSMEGLLNLCFKKSEPEYEKLSMDLTKSDNRVLQANADRFDAGAVLDTLRTLPMPVVIVHGMNDPIVNLPSEDVWRYVTEGNDESLLPIPLSGARHFPMLESDTFQRIVGLFLETQSINDIQVKERWRRRSR